MQFRGSGYYYGQDDRFNSTNYFTKLDGRAKPESGNDIIGASIGGPIVRNKAFFFFNTERQWLKDALDLKFPAEAAPLATSFSDAYDVNLTKYFARVDYQLTPGHNLRFSTIWNPNTGIGEVAEAEVSLRENFRYERAKETINSAHWTAVLNNRMLNEFKLSSTIEHLRQAARDLYNADFNNDPFDPETHEIIGLEGADPLDFGAQQQHPSYRAGPRAGTAAHYWNTIALTEQFTFTPGNHTWRFGFGAGSYGGTSLHGARRRGRALWPVQLPDGPAVRPGEPLHLSESLSDSPGRFVLRHRGLAHQRLRLGQVAGDGQADAEPRRAVRLLGHRAGHEGRLRAADWRGVCRERPDGLPRRHRQVLRAGAERSSCTTSWGTR